MNLYEGRWYLDARDFVLPATDYSIATGGPPGARAYKSRKNRPCDFCRARKSACRIAVAPPCFLCRTSGRDCTFVQSPPKRRKPVPAPAPAMDQVQWEHGGLIGKPLTWSLPFVFSTPPLSGWQDLLVNIQCHFLRLSHARYYYILDDWLSLEPSVGSNVRQGSMTTTVCPCSYLLFKQRSMK